MVVQQGRLNGLWVSWMLLTCGLLQPLTAADAIAAEGSGQPAAGASTRFFIDEGYFLEGDTEILRAYISASDGRMTISGESSAAFLSVKVIWGLRLRRPELRNMAPPQLQLSRMVEGCLVVFTRLLSASADAHPYKPCTPTPSYPCTFHLHRATTPLRLGMCTGPSVKPVTWPTSTCSHTRKSTVSLEYQQCHSNATLYRHGRRCEQGAMVRSGWGHIHRRLSAALYQHSLMAAAAAAAAAAATSGVGGDCVLQPHPLQAWSC